MLGGRYPTAEQLSAAYHTFDARGAGAQAVSTRDIHAQLPGVAKTKTQVALSVLKEAGYLQEGRAGKWSLARSGVPEEQLADLAPVMERAECPGS